MKNFCIKTLNGMALGLFSSLIIGLILKQCGQFLHFPVLIQFGTLAQYFMGPAIGVGVAYSLQVSPLILIASLITGAFGAGTIQFVEGTAQIKIGEPMGAYIASLVAALLITKLSGKTKLDIILLPACTIIVGCLVGIFISPEISLFIKYLGEIINKATKLHPVMMGIVLAVSMGMILTLPISSAAIGISLGLHGLAAGAALVGCCCQMIGFATISYRENGMGGFLSQGIGTSMLQIPNIIKNPWIWLPPTLASAILGPLSTTIFHMESNSVGSGMGTSGLIGQISTLEVMGGSSIPSMLLLHFFLPALLSYLFAQFLRKKNKIKVGDMTL
ncbi:MAG TPA: PTS sugar transporter subunit IIC [Fusobacterium sp.]|uniref:PTS transporter subunit IIC n=1 Tax=Fusobacterium sp. TaxID=68766 RepID=UPI002F3E715A